MAEQSKKLVLTTRSIITVETMPVTKALCWLKTCRHAFCVTGYAKKN